MSIFGASSVQELLIFLCIKVFIIFAILPIHEYAHALAAKKMGDNTAMMMGRLTLNPLKHIDPIGALLILFVGFGWAKPVPVNPRNFRDYKKGEIIVSFAGPFSNLVCATIGALLFRIAFNFYMYTGTTAWYYAFMAISLFVQINISLAVFNLIPIPPLDGSHILFCFTSYKVRSFMSRYQHILYYGLVIFIATGVLSGPFSFITGSIYNGLLAVFSWVDKIFVLFM